MWPLENFEVQSPNKVAASKLRTKTSKSNQKGYWGTGGSPEYDPLGIWGMTYEALVQTYSFPPLCGLCGANGDFPPIAPEYVCHVPCRITTPKISSSDTDNKELWGFLDS